MAAANAGRIDHTQPGPIDTSVLKLQPTHQSEAIWNGQDPGALTCRGRTEEFSNREPMVDDQVVDIIKALGLEGLLRQSGSTQKNWMNVCEEFLGFQPINQEHKELNGQRILIKWLLEQVANPLPPDVEEDELHKYARCYILVLLGDTIFMDKSGDRVHLMASHKDTSQIGGCLLLVQHWVWAKFPYLCPAVERGLPVGAYGPPARGPLYLKWLRVPNKKNRPAHIFRDRYRQQIASMLPSQVVWQPYEADFKDLPPWCVAGRAVWTATVPLVCFHLVEIHTPDRVVHQFGMIQEIPGDVDTDTVLHAIDLRGKVGVD
uniref:Aminotransferase-like plant mobile domain-containing protein n=1 Tax=Quercus lobata TaxID=97700 RepID=A0A7N2MST3_QUELO